MFDTRIVKAEHGIKEGAELINSGELVVFPTETVYGLGANALDEEAVKKIFVAKGRPQDNPLIVHIAKIEQVYDVAADVPDKFFRLAELFMPGPLTVILKKGDKIPYAVTAGGETVGVRMPANEHARALIGASKPLAAPSANRSKHISPTKAEHVYEDLKGEIPLILDDGACQVGIESTVLDLTSEIATILRPGAITAEMLLPIVGTVSENGKIIKIAKAPGMKYTHYAPKIEAVVAQSVQSAIEKYDQLAKEGKHPVLVFRTIYPQIEGRNVISLGESVEDYAKNVYSALHDAEKRYDYIIIERLVGDGLESSIMNRVEKAAGGKIV